MAVGGGGKIIEQLITQVSLQGAETVSTQQRLIAAGFRGVSGDIAGMRQQLAGLKLTTREYLIAGGAMIGVGAGLVAYMRRAADAAAQQEAAESRLAAAFAATGQGSQQNADSIARYAGELQRLTGAGDEQIVNAAAILASFKMNEDQVRQFLPRILDLQQGMQKLGKEAIPMEQLAVMLGKTFADPRLVTSLRRFGVVIDQNDVATRGYIAVLEGLDRSFGGQAAARMKTYAGQMDALSNAISDVHEAIGMGVLSLTPVIGIVTKMTLGFAAFNEKIHGAAGIVIALTGGLAMMGGTILLVTPAITTLRNLWIQVTGAANAAAAAQMKAAAAGAGAGAAAGGRLGLGGRLGRGGAALGFGILGPILGGLLSGWGKQQEEEMLRAATEEARSKSAAKAALGSVGGGALTGAGIGAAAGSIIPGLGTALGAMVGAGGGAIWAAVSTALGFKKEQAASAAAAVAERTAKVGPQAETNDWLAQIAGLLKDQNRMMIGGGARAQKAINEGDMQRAVFAMLSKQVI